MTFRRTFISNFVKVFVLLSVIGYYNFSGLTTTGVDNQSPIMVYFRVGNTCLTSYNNPKIVDFSAGLAKRKTCEIYEFMAGNIFGKIV